MDILDYINKIMSIATSLIVTISAIYVASSFRYKYDAEIRDLYLNNCRTVCATLDEIIREARTSTNGYNCITDALVDAETFLHKDIIKFVESIRKNIADLLHIEKRLEALPVGDKRNKFCDKQEEILIKVSEKRREVRKIYRKYLINEPFENIGEFFNKQFVKFKNKLDQLFAKN